jgi:uncharacterized protein (DUF1330 family)
MAACLIGSLDITDLAGFAGNARQAPAVIAAYGGRYLICSGAEDMVRFARIGCPPRPAPEDGPRQGG